ncbi:diguanylate cyclase [Elstera litoralis]|uniref:diguanylate cyclase n=1 Tax=Elstera litoralis TaxID=552518 RepID=UPI000697F77D|nr:diguanylate cyclase [Elstera litoralis]
MPASPLYRPLADENPPRPTVCIYGADEALRRVLKDIGYQCIMLPDPGAALPATGKPPIAVFRELLLRNEAENATVEPGHPPTIFTTATDTVADRLAALRAGGLGFLARPYQIDEVDRLMRVAIRHATSERSLRRLMIVEDDASMARLVSGYLGQKGYQVKHVEDPMQLLEALASFRPAALLLDLNLPQVSGAELAAIIRQFPTFTTLPILFLSGETDSMTQIQALRCGADGFLSKPIRANELLGRIDAVLTRLEELDHLVHRDHLTGLPNRRAFLLELEQALASAQRTQRPLSLAIIDVDHFKSINDTFGHLTGDRVLKRLANHLQTSLRREDYIGRIGGEEFAILLPGADVNAAIGVLDASRASCKRACGGLFPEIAGVTAPRMVSFSGGVIGVTDYGDAENMAEFLLDRADEALYRAKAAGRDRLERG